MVVQAVLGGNLPDALLNVLILGVAADAIWQEPSYLHGAIAWRMPLNGWRGAYTADPLGWLQDMILPCLALGVAGGASIARQLRGSLIDVLDQDYIRTARSMGLKHRRIIGVYALKNAATPVLTVVGLQFAYLLGGTFIIEQIFSIPGMGQYILGAIDTKDLPVIQGVVLVTAVIFVFVNLLVDISYGYLTPKVRSS